MEAEEPDQAAVPLVAPEEPAADVNQMFARQLDTSQTCRRNWLKLVSNDSHFISIRILLRY